MRRPAGKSTKASGGPLQLSRGLDLSWDRKNGDFHV